MSSSDHIAAPQVAVVGATGVVGRRVCGELLRLGARVTAVGRRPEALADLARSVPVHAVQLADARDAGELARALIGSRAVINAAGPLRDTAAAVLSAALSSGAHYVDIGGEQAVLQEIYEHHDAAARRAGVVALPGAGVDCTLGDLAAGWAAAHLLADRDAGEPVRSEPARWLAEGRPLDEIAVSYVFDHLVLSAGSQRSLFAAIGTRPLLWRRDRWEPGRPGDHRRINVGPALGGERDAHAFAAGDVLTIPRHVAAQRVATYLSTTRRPGMATALRLLSRALPHIPRGAGELLAPYAAPDADYARAQLAVVVQVRRGFSAAQILVRGHDLYRTTAVIAAWSACQLAERGAGPVGMRAPGELFRAEPALRAIASAADLTIEPSFG